MKHHQILSFWGRSRISYFGVYEEWNSYEIDGNIVWRKYLCSCNVKRVKTRYKNLPPSLYTRTLPPSLIFQKFREFQIMWSSSVLISVILGNWDYYHQYRRQSSRVSLDNDVEDLIVLVSFGQEINICWVSTHLY